MTPVTWINSSKDPCVESSVSRPWKVTKSLTEPVGGLVVSGGMPLKGTLGA